MLEVPISSFISILHDDDWVDCEDDVVLSKEVITERFILVGFKVELPFVFNPINVTFIRLNWSVHDPV